MDNINNNINNNGNYIRFCSLEFTKESNPKKLSKVDKTIRNSKKINTKNNPNLSNATLDVIDSFFKD